MKGREEKDEEEMFQTNSSALDPGCLKPFGR